MPSHSTQALHLQRVRRFFSTLPPLHPETVDIVLRTHLNVPEELIPLAREEVEQQHKPPQAA